MADVKKTCTDSQTSGMAGEFLVAGKLFKRGLQVSVTMGNAKAIDLLVHNAKTDNTFEVQVKTVRCKNCFLIHKEDIHSKHIYVFVLLNHIDQNEEFFILRGETILKDINHFFGSSYSREKPSTMPAINYGTLKEYKDNWKLFDLEVSLKDGER
jgi:hypothetical protein